MKGSRLFINVVGHLVICFVLHSHWAAARDPLVLPAKTSGFMQKHEPNFYVLPSWNAAHVDIWKKINGPEWTFHPEFGILPYDAPCRYCVEVLEKRTADERYFVDINNHAVFYIQKTLGPLHYRKNGYWLSIDPRIRLKSPGIYEASHQWDPTGFDLNVPHSYIITPAGKITFNKWKLYGTANGHDTLLAIANWTRISIGEDGILIEEIFPGIDAQMQVMRGSVKTNFIIKQLVFAHFPYLLFTDEFGVPAESHFVFEGSANAPHKQLVGKVYLIKNESSILDISAAGAYAEDQPANSYFPLEYRIGSSELSVVVPVAFIRHHLKNGKVIIDPLVSSSNTLAQAAISGSQYNANCNFTASCNHSLTVNTPAGATLTDIQWSFHYTATLPCVMRDGAIRLRTGSCISPSQSGYFWFCNSPLPGNCRGDTISIFNDLSLCLPNPSCTPQPVTFELQFFRSCSGNAGCNNSCIGAATPWTMYIKGHTLEFTNPSSTISVSQNTICHGQTISASTNIRYGVPPYTVSWSFNANGVPAVANGATATISFPSPGSYSLYAFVTDACNNTISDQRLINVNAIPTVTASSNSPVCQGQTLSLSVNSTPAGSYNWSGPNNYNTSQQNPNINNATPAASGTYTVTVTANGCSASASVQAVVHPRPTVSITPATASVCAGNAITLTATGGSTYLWSTSETTASISASPASNTSYSVTITDANGCSNTASRTVTVSNPPNAVIMPATPSICPSQNITLTASGGASYMWNTNATSPSITVSPASTATYSVTVTGSNGCTATALRDVVVHALPLVDIAPAVASICTGSSITLTASGGISYTWSTSHTTASITVSPTVNTTYSVTATDANGCTANATRTVAIAANLVISITPGQPVVCRGASVTLNASGAVNYTWSTQETSASITVSPLVNTTYSVTGSDANGCTGSAIVNVAILPDPTITILPTTATICEGSSIDMSASGAVSYMWSTQETSSTINVSPLQTTIYSVTGTDVHGCTATATKEVIVYSTPVVVIQPLNATLCAGESISLIASGGISYQWSNNETDAFITVSPSVNTTYSVTATDGNGCTAAVARQVVVNTPPVAAISPASAQICRGQPVTLTASGGSHYVWSTTHTTAAITVTPNQPATYIVTVTDANGCTAIADAQVDTINNLSLSTQHTDASCYGSSDGTIDIIPIGGTTPFSFLWNDGYTNEDRSGLPAGQYSVTATGSDGCMAELSVIIQQPAALSVNELIVNESCVGSVDGSIALTTAGGTPPYQFAWSNGNNTSQLNYVAQGTYAVTVIDQNGCSFIETFTIGQNAPLTISPLIISPSCPPASDGSIELNISGGNAGFFYRWSNEATTSDIRNLTPGSYSVTVTDSRGCTAIAGPFHLDYQYTLAISASPTDTTLTMGAASPLWVVDNSLSDVHYSWSPSIGLSCNQCDNPIASPFQSTTYIVTAMNASGCSDTDTIVIYIEEPGTLFVPNSFSPNNDGVNDIFMIYGLRPEFVESFHLSIYNRWGEKVFDTQQVNFSWDGTYKGKLLNPGVFVYHLKYVLQGGKSVEEQKGSLFLLR